MEAPPPSDIEMTRSPCCAAQTMQFATPEIAPLPEESSALHIDSFELNATPATPLPLFAIAAIVPATCVPWSLSSAHLSATTVGSPPITPRNGNEFTPAQSAVWPTRSSWLWSMPVSTTPTFTPLPDGNPPRPASSQPVGACMSERP